MKNFFFIPLLLCIYTVISFTAKAQPSVKNERDNITIDNKKTIKFIEESEKRGGLNRKTSLSKTNKDKTYLNILINDEFSTIENFTCLHFKYAQLLNIEVELITNITLFNEMVKWWGTPYRYGGATANGIDCSAYTSALISQAYGLIIARTSRDQYKDCVKLAKEDILQGDLVFFKTRRGVSHVGLYLGNGYFTHASTSIGVTISNFSESYWSSKYVGSGRINSTTTWQ